MSRDVSIELTFGSHLTVGAVLARLTEAGWGAVHDGQIKYMVGDYDWYKVDQSQRERVREEMTQCAADGRSTAISLWGAEGHGVNVLFLPGTGQVIVSLDLNRRPLPGAPKLTDLAWYLERLVPPVVELGLLAVIARDAYDE